MFFKWLLCLTIFASINIRITFTATQMLKINDEIVSSAGDVTLSESKSEESRKLQVQLLKLDEKLSVLQQSVEAHGQFGRKLTAMDLTLNHVLSKLIYLSEHSQINSNSDTKVHLNGTAHYANVAKVNEISEISSRVTQLLRHVQNIERDHCRRSSIPAAAGPVISNKSDQLLKPQLANIDWGSQRFHKIEELLQKLELRLNVISKFTNSAAEIRQIPNLIKQNSAQITRVLDSVGQCINEESQQQGLQQMIEYCQSVSEEFSTFSGSSDALLKRIESIVQDTKSRVENLRVDDVVNAHKNQPQCDHQLLEQQNSTKLDPNLKNDYDKLLGTTGKEQNKANPAPAKSGCHELDHEKDDDGIYAFGLMDVNEAGRDFNNRLCKFATDERAWTVIQRRGPYEVQENFNRSWIDYRNGFGNLSKDFWFGNEFVHRLTYFNNYELLIELENHEGGNMSISYGTFGLDSERVNYNLFVGDYKGSGPDSLSYHNFMDFSTYDRRNDKSVDACCPCAIGYGSGWWFDNCLEANLNGVYRFTPNYHNYVGIIWDHWLGDYSLKATRMLIRPKSL